MGSLTFSCTVWSCIVWSRRGYVLARRRNVKDPRFFFRIFIPTDIMMGSLTFSCTVWSCVVWSRQARRYSVKDIRFFVHKFFQVITTFSCSIGTTLFCYRRSDFPAWRWWCFVINDANFRISTGISSSQISTFLPSRVGFGVGFKGFKHCVSSAISCWFI